MEKRLAFKFYSSYYDVAQELNDNERLAFYDALMKRQFLGLETELKGMAKFAYISQKHSIDKQIEGWESKMKTSLNQQIKGSYEGGSQGGIKGGIKDPSQQEEEKEQVQEEEKVEEVYKGYLFSEIKNFKSFYSSFEFNKQYFHIAYKFWEMWKEENPNNVTIKKAKLVNWYETIRLIIEVDKQKIERLIAVYKYFQKCQSKDPGFRDFWFKTVKSVGGLRDTNNKGEYRLDKIADEVNDKIEKDEMFGRLVEKSINDFKKYSNECN